MKKIKILDDGSGMNLFERITIMQISLLFTGLFFRGIDNEWALICFAIGAILPAFYLILED